MHMHNEQKRNEVKGRGPRSASVFQRRSACLRPHALRAAAGLWNGDPESCRGHIPVNISKDNRTSPLTHYLCTWNTSPGNESGGGKFTQKILTPELGEWRTCKSVNDQGPGVNTVFLVNTLQGNIDTMYLWRMYMNIRILCERSQRQKFV